MARRSSKSAPSPEVAPTGDTPSLPAIEAGRPADVIGAPADPPTSAVQEPAPSPVPEKSRWINKLALLKYVPVLAFAVGVIALFINWWNYTKTAELILDYNQVVPLLNPLFKTTKIKVLSGDKPVKTPFVIVATLKNPGRLAIEGRTILTPPSITFAPHVQLLEASVRDRLGTGIKIRTEIKGNTLVFLIDDMLNRNESAEVEILCGRLRSHRYASLEGTDPERGTLHDVLSVRLKLRPCHLLRPRLSNRVGHPVLHLMHSAVPALGLHREVATLLVEEQLPVLPARCDLPADDRQLHPDRCWSLVQPIGCGWPSELIRSEPIRPGAEHPRPVPRTSSILDRAD